MFYGSVQLSILILERRIVVVVVVVAFFVVVVVVAFFVVVAASLRCSLFAVCSFVRSFVRSGSPRRPLPTASDTARSGSVRGRWSVDGTGQGGEGRGEHKRRSSRAGRKRRRCK